MNFWGTLILKSQKDFLRGLHVPCRWLCTADENCSNSLATMKILNVAEKNDAAKNIAFHLSRGNSRKVNRHECLLSLLNVD